MRDHPIWWVTLAMLLSCGATANAALPHSVREALPRARAYWGPPLCPNLRVGVTPLNLDFISRGFHVVAAAYQHRCLLVVDRDFVADAPAWIVCEAVLHEYGHLVGRAHSTDRRAIMFHTLGARHTPCRGMRSAYSDTVRGSP